MPRRKTPVFGICPKCNFGELEQLKSKNSYGRYIKCDNEECGKSYPIPKAGIIEYTALKCPVSKYPILMVTKNGSKKPYFWVDKPHFTCKEFVKGNCQPIKDLEKEFIELGVNGY